MITLSQLAESTEFLQFQVAALNGGAAYNPSGDAAFVAFVPVTEPPPSPDPTSGQWNTASWEVDSGPVYWLSILVGPLNGGVVLTAGSYTCYVKITDNPAVPVKPAAYLTIT